MEDGTGWEGAIEATACALGPEMDASVDDEPTGGLASSVGGDGQNEAPPATPHGSVVHPPPAASSFDPWALLDPHDPGAGLTRPFRRGKTYQAVPEAVQHAEEREKENNLHKDGNRRDVVGRLGLEPHAAEVSLKLPLWAQVFHRHPKRT